MLGTVARVSAEQKVIGTHSRGGAGKTKTTHSSHRATLSNVITGFGPRNVQIWAVALAQICPASQRP